MFMLIIFVMEVKDFFLYKNSWEKINCTHHRSWMRDDLIVILSHGFFSDKNSYTNQQLSNLLQEDAVDTLAFDFYGHGQSDWEINNITISKTLEDFNCVLDYVKNNWYKKIWIVGSCLWAISIMEMAKIQGVDSICVKSAFLEPSHFSLFNDKEFLEYRKKIKNINFQQNERKNEEMSHNTNLNYDFYDDLEQVSWDMKLEINVPTLFVHAEHDELIPLSGIQNVVDQFANAYLRCV